MVQGPATDYLLIFLSFLVQTERWEQKKAKMIRKENKKRGKINVCKRGQWSRGSSPCLLQKLATTRSANIINAIIEKI